MAKKTSSTVSYDSGKFKVIIDYSFTDSAITWKATVDVTDAFKSKHTYKLEWKDKNGNWQSKKTSSTRKSDYTFAQKTLAKQTLNVKVTVGSKTVTMDAISRSTAAAAPTSIDVKKINDAHFTITVKGSGYPTRPTNKLIIERNEGSRSVPNWEQIGPEHTVNETGAYEHTYTDNTTEPGKNYWWRVKAVNTIGGDSGYITSGESFTTPDATVSNITVSRSGTKNVISWGYNSITNIDRKLVTGFKILRSKDGGSYTEVATVAADVTKTTYSYDDTNANIDGVYKYAIQIIGSGGTAFDIQECDTEVATTPSKPMSVEAYLDASDHIVVAISSNSTAAESVIIERKIDAGSWTVIAEEDYPVDHYIDSSAIAGDSIIYRVCNSNDTGNSDYTVSNMVETKSKPNPPELKAPINGAVFNIEEGTVSLTWQHKSTDGSPQTAAQVRYKIGSGAWHTYTKTTESQHSLSLMGLSARDVITWQARTKGSYADYSEWSDTYSFTILSKPELHFTSPVNGAVITQLPLVLSWTYDDYSGILKELYIDIIEDNKVVATYETLTSPFSLTGFLFDTDKVYGIRARALSTSGLSTSETITVSIQYESVSIAGALLPTVEGDEETGYAYITIMRDITPDDDTGVIPDPVQIAEAYLYRIHDKVRELVGPVYEGAQITDEYAPINVTYEYELLMLTASGNVSIVKVECENPSEYWFVYYGDKKIARAKWNPVLSGNIGHPEKTGVRYAGREYEVSYDSGAIEEKASFQTTLIDREDLVAFKEMSRLGGQGIWKSGDGDVYYADLEFRWDTDKKNRYQVWDCTIDVKRIEKEA